MSLADCYGGCLCPGFTYRPTCCEGLDRETAPQSVDVRFKSVGSYYTVPYDPCEGDCDGCFDINDMVVNCPYDSDEEHYIGTVTLPCEGDIEVWVYLSCSSTGPDDAPIPACYVALREPDGDCFAFYGAGTSEFGSPIDICSTSSALTGWVQFDKETNYKFPSTFISDCSWDGYTKPGFLPPEYLACEYPESYVEVKGNWGPGGMSVASSKSGPPSIGAGDLLNLIIWLCTGEREESCTCRKWVRQCNAWGWKGTWRHRQEILQVLADNAEKRGYSVAPTLRSMAWAAARAAFSRKNFRRIRATLAQTLGGGVD